MFKLYCATTTMRFKFLCSAIWILVSFATVKAITVHIDRTSNHNIPSTLCTHHFISTFNF